MSVQLSPRIVELIASRICHDLVSPVGAINNGMEFLEDMGPEAGQDAMNLISSSVEQASNRLKCFRLCYGAAGTEKNVTFKDIQDAFFNLTKSGRVGFTVLDNATRAVDDPPRGYLKTLLNVLILAEECSHGDGRIEIGKAASGEISKAASGGHVVTVFGPKAAFREGAEAALKGSAEIDSLDPRSVHPYVTGRFADHFGFRLAIEAKPKESLSFTLST